MPAIEDKTRWWNREDLVLLVLMGILFFLPGLGRIPLFDRDEPRFAVAARTMAQTGDYIVPHFNGALRPDKPPLVYWLMNVTNWAVEGWGTPELGARLPSAICGILTLVVVYFMVGARFGRLTGIIASMILGSSTLFVVESRLATADSTMIFFIATAMACAWQAWDAGAPDLSASNRGGPKSRPRHLPRTDYLLDRSSEKPAIVLDQMDVSTPRRMPLSLALLFWFALACGTLTKGVPLLFVLVPMFTLSYITRQWHWWRQLRPLVGIPLFLALVGWWVIWAGIATDWKLINDMVSTHFLLRVAGPLLKWLGFNPVDAAANAGGGGNDSMQSYGKPPGFYLLTVWGTFFPWSVLLVPAAFHAFKRMRGRIAIAIDPRPYQFLVAWVVPMWILLELSRGKLFHYPLPTFVAISILCADALVQSWHRLTDVFAAPWFAATRWIMLAIWTALGATILSAAYRYLDPDAFWRAVPFGAAIIATGVAGTISWDKPSWPIVMTLAWGGTLLFASIIFLPDFVPLQVSRLAGQYMLEIKKSEPDFHFAAAGYEEPTLVFYAADNVLICGGPDNLLKSVPFLPDGPPSAQDKYLIAIDDHALSVLDDRKITYYRLQRFTGYNAANFKPITLNIISNVLPRIAAPSASTTSSQPSTAPTPTPESAPASRSTTAP